MKSYSIYDGIFARIQKQEDLIADTQADVWKIADHLQDLDEYLESHPDDERAARLKRITSKQLNRELERLTYQRAFLDGLKEAESLF